MSENQRSAYAACTRIALLASDQERVAEQPAEITRLKAAIAGEQ